MKNLTLSDLVFLSQQSDNIIITNWLIELKELIETTPNNFDLGSEVRKLL